jgi:hypothetical protein
MRFLATSALRIVSMLLAALLIATLLLFAMYEILISYLEEDNA